MRRVKSLKADLQKYKEIAESKVYPQRLRSPGDHESEPVSVIPVCSRLRVTLMLLCVQSDDEAKGKKADASDAEAQVG